MFASGSWPLESKWGQGASPSTPIYERMSDREHFTRHLESLSLSHTLDTSLLH